MYGIYTKISGRDVFKFSKYLVMVILMENLIEELINLRRELHKFPEPGFKEYKTSKFISNYLKNLNLTVFENIEGTGVIAFLKGHVGKKSTATRSEMDGLNVIEKTNVPFSSENKGYMHACGHDGHMAAQLFLAKKLSFNNNLKNNTVFIFQPAEEGPGGAKPVVENGILSNFNISSVLSMHIFPELDEGIVGCCRGPITASNAEVDLKITGKSSHGAMPHKGIDSIVAASSFILSVQSIVSRRIEPGDGAVVTFGKIKGGEVRNIIAGETMLEGTIRTFEENNYNLIKDSLFKATRGIEEAYGVKSDIEIRDMYPSVLNDENLFIKLKEAVEPGKLAIIKPLMIAEDFSYYKRIAPTLMFMFGSRNKEKGYVYPLHNSKFNFDEKILLNAVNIFERMIYKLDEN